MLNMVNEFQDYQFVIGGVSTIEKEYYDSMIGKKNVSIVWDNTYNLLSQAHAALVTSGTATLETGLFKVPQVVCYKGSTISYQIGKRFVDVKYISLVNLILDKEVVKELIQNEFNISNLKVELAKILDSSSRLEMKNKYEELARVLGRSGASRKAAQIVHDLVS